MGREAAARDAAIKAEPYFTGNGGKGKRIAILVPEYKGPQEAGVNIPRLLQSAFIADFNKYSALSVLDRETLDPIYRDNLDIVRLGQITQTDYIITGTIIKTSAGYAVSVHIANTQDGSINAAHIGTYTLKGLENLTGIHKATAALLPALGVTLTDRATRELTGPATARREARGIKYS